MEHREPEPEPWVSMMSSVLRKPAPGRRVWSPGNSGTMGTHGVVTVKVSCLGSVRGCQPSLAGRSGWPSTPVCLPDNSQE